MTELVSIAVQCKNLKDGDVLSKSDPFVEFKEGTRTIGKTETIKNELNPSFSTHISVHYFFESKQSITALVWDFDGDGSHDLLGSVTFTLGKLMSATNSTLQLQLEPKGSITLVGLHEGSGYHGNVKISIRGKQLKNMDTFGKSDPFYILSRVLPNGTCEPLHKSDVVDDNLNPVWKNNPSIMTLQKLCGGDVDRRVIKIEVFDEDVTSNDTIGEVLTSLREIGSADGGYVSLPLKDPSGKSAGSVEVKCTTMLENSFLDLLKAGLQLNIAFSIDFTGSNLEAKNPKSLHYYHPTQPNQYIQAMIAVSDVVQEYDSDRQFPAFGFGAILPGSHEANHFFHLNLGPNPYIGGMQGVIDTYVQTLQQIRFYGPTNFAPTIRNVANGARQAPGVYTILLIMTDGEITDMDDTITEIVNADDAPFSILIVGVGMADFGSMEQLDCDNGMLRSRSGRISRRDIVQFVPMREYINRGGADLAAALLAEIPTQVSRWAMMNPQAVAQFTAAAAAAGPPAQQTA